MSMTLCAPGCGCFWSGALPLESRTMCRKRRPGKCTMQAKRNSCTQFCRNFRLSQRTRGKRAIILREGTDETMSYFNEIYGDPELSSKAKMVLLYLHDRANKKGESWYAINTIAKDLCLSRSSVKRAMSELIQRGKIKKRARFRENGGNTSNLYSLNV